MRALLSFVILVFVAACDASPERDIGTPDKPLVDNATQSEQDLARLAELRAASDADMADLPVPVAARSYTLAELIDIAQQRNPATRQAWLFAREAGRQAGVIGTALAPVVALSAVAGRQEFNTNRTLPLTGTRPVPASAQGSAIILSANWLLFDFGENQARQDAATQLSRVAELGFTRMHQQLVYDVTFAYHARIAALAKSVDATRAAKRAATLINVAERRLSSGLGTEVEVAQARQLAAQTRLIEQAAKGEARAAAVNIAALLALPPGTPVRVTAPKGKLPGRIDGRMEQVIEQAFLRRTDVRAALAQVNAAEADMTATAAAYLPKVYGGGYASTGSGALDLNGILPIGINSTGSSGVFVGVSVPVYDGGLRETRLRGAEDRIAQTRLGVQVAMLAASREIAIAYEGLQTALALRNAASELVTAARVTYDGAQEGYAGGIGTIGEVSAAALGLYSAQEAKADAARDAYQAAATLALAAGQ